MPDVLALLDAALGGVPGAQPREGQRRMAAAVEQALACDEHLLVQAGTGTGKSLGYLVPAVASGRTVVVATATKALQAQLVDKDLPALADALEGPLGRRPTFALAKGRGNYACLQQLDGGPGAVPPDQDDLFDGPTSTIGQQVVRLREWAQSSATGDRDEVPFPVSDRAWRQVSVSARDCLGPTCPARLDCFAEKAREAAREVDVVVANHALLALHATSGRPVLPEHDAVVLDEAHEFADAATDALTLELSAGSARRAAAAAAPLLAAAGKDRLDDAVEVLTSGLAALAPGWQERLDDATRNVLRVVEGAFSAASVELGGLSDGDEEAAAGRARARTALDDVVDAARAALEPAVPSAVSVTGGGASAVLRTAPLSVGGVLAARLLATTTVVATSATLTLGGRFDHTAGQLGLAPSRGVAAEEAVPLQPRGDDEPRPARWRYLDVGSPFDHPRQGQLWVASSLPDPGRQPAAWAAAVDELLVELVTAAGGRTLGLFSSTAAAARAAAAVREACDVPVLLQGDDSPGALQHAFAGDPRTCLFGTRSFWQGVDVPGSACQLVVIDRLPFGHVDDPLTKARLAAAGPRGFVEVQLPPAAVLLAQGAGRLLRSTEDRGVVAVLDPRLATAGYRDVLLATLPPFYRARSKESVLASLRAIDAGAPPVRDPGPPPSARRAAART